MITVKNSIHLESRNRIFKIRKQFTVFYFVFVKYYKKKDKRKLLERLHLIITLKENIHS